MTHTYIESLQADIEMTKEIIKSQSIDLIAEMRGIIEKHIVIPADAMIVKNDIRLGFANELVMSCEIGFWNDKDNRIDFGSECFIEFTQINGLRINYGIMGYIGKENIYQMKRLNLFGLFYNKYDTIESDLKTLCIKAQNWYETSVQLKEKEAELKEEFDKIIATHMEEISNSLAVDQRLQYVSSEKIAPSNRVLGSKFFRDGDQWEITKLTKTYVWCKNITFNTSEEKIKRESLIEAIAKNYIEVVGD